MSHARQSNGNDKCPELPPRSHTNKPKQRALNIDNENETQANQGISKNDSQSKNENI